MMDRSFGTLNISVGTSIAIETLSSLPLLKYTSFLINIRTLIRNAIGSFDKDAKLTDEIVFNAVRSDMLEIASAIASLKLKTELKLIFYSPSYNSLKSMFPLASLKDDSKGTAKQQANYKLTKSVMDKIKSEFKDLIEYNNVLLPEFTGEALIITHHPVDLATSPAYTRLTLLESHTGTIKRFPDFYTKLTGYKTMANIPLNKITIQIFGDNSVDFYSHSKLSVKNALKALADETKWTSASTPSFVYRTIRGLSDGPDKETLLKMI